MTFQRVYSGAPLETQVGYCRALRADNLIFVTGTAPLNEDGTTHAPDDAYAQTRRCLAIIERALNDLGADLTCVVRTRLYVTDINRQGEYGRAHADAFQGHHPTTTMVGISALVAPDMLIEIEADAIVAPSAS